MIASEEGGIVQFEITRIVFPGSFFRNKMFNYKIITNRQGFLSEIDIGFRVCHEVKPQNKAVVQVVSYMKFLWDF